MISPYNHKGLPGVTISNFKLPSNDPAGGIHIETDSSIPSPAQLGIALGSVTFQSYFGSTLVGPLSASSMTLAPQATTKIHLAGRIVPQSGDDLKNIGTLFTNFLHGQNQTLTVKGDSVNPGNGTVSWLSTAFKTVELQVILPGQKFDVRSIYANKARGHTDGLLRLSRAFPLATSKP
jgi:Protein of unknown function (DUF3712)